MTAHPKTEQHRWGFYASVMAAGLVLSMAGNATHVWSQWQTDVAAGVDRGSVSPWVPTIAIAVVPAMVLVMTEMVVISYRRNTGWARAVVTALAALVGVVALVVSYVGLVHVCTVIIGLPTALGYIAPVIVDAPIIAATIGLWDVQQRIRADADRVAVAEPVDRPLTERSTSQLVRPTEPVDHVSELAPTDRSTTADEQPDEPVEFDSTEPVDQNRPTRSTGHDQVVHLVEQIPTDRSTELNEPVEFARVDRSTAIDQMVDHTPDEQLDRALGQRSTEQDEQPDEPVEFAPAKQSTTADEQSDERLTEPDELVDWAEMAASIRSTTSITADVDDLATVLRMDAAGATRAEIAAAVGRAKSTVSGWIRTADSVSRPQPALVAVD